MREGEKVGGSQRTFPEAASPRSEEEAGSDAAAGSLVAVWPWADCFLLCASVSLCVK